MIRQEIARLLRALANRLDPQTEWRHEWPLVYTTASAPNVTVTYPRSEDG